MTGLLARLRYEEWDFNRKLIALCAAAVLVLVVWASIASLDEITRGMGKVVPSSKVQLVQAATPATVTAILVRPGQLVQQGQLLVSLDDSQSSSALGQLEAENQRLSARASRLTQEGGGGGSNCGPGMACAEEAQLSAARQATAQQPRGGSGSCGRTAPARFVGRPGDDRFAGKQRQACPGSGQHAGPAGGQGHCPQTELLTAQRELVDVQGRLSAARQGVGRASASIAEAQAQLSQARNDFRQQALNERSEVATKLAVNQETIKGASARLERNELRAPVTGLVNDVAVTTVGGFVNAGEKIMQVVPVGEKLLIEARIAPKDIAFIKTGDRAIVKVTAYDFSIYGGLSGKVRNISADSIYDEVERQAYYNVMVETDRAFLVKNGRRLPIMPGMICDVEIITGSKSVLTYLLKPVMRAFDEALTER